MLLRTVGLLTVLTTSVLPGCPKDKDGGKADASASALASADAGALAASSASDAGGAVASAATVEGVGVIPPWTAEIGRGKACKAAPAAKARMKALAKGDDADVSANKTDPAALEKELAPDCRAAERELSEAFNNGGFVVYKRKQLKEASRWWRDALVVRPSFVLARFNLACALALDGAKAAAIAQVRELARAADSGDAGASNLLEKAKSDADLASVRDDPAFKEALKAATGGLVGPRKEPETSAAAVKLLPDTFKKGPNPAGGTTTYKPALVQVWTWRPNTSTELLVATVVHDPATLGKPKGDLNNDYGGIVVLSRDGAKVSLLTARKTGESPPEIAAGKNNTVAYSFGEPCGDLRGSLAFKDGRVVVTQSQCGDDPPK